MKFINKEILFVISALLLIYYPTIAEQIKYASDFDYYHEEERVLATYYQMQDDSLFQDDYINDFIKASPKSYTFYLMNKVWAKYFDLRILYKLFPMILWVIFIASMGIAAWKLGGVYAAWSTAALTLTQPIFLYQISSSIPHAFAYPLMGLMLVALLYARVYMLACITILSSLFYPAVTPIIGLSMAYLLLVTKREHRGKAKEWSMWKRMTLLAVTGITVCLLTFLAMEHADNYGRYIAPNSDVEHFPESGDGGAHFIGITFPIPYVIAKLSVQFFDTDIITNVIGVICVLTFFIVPIRGWRYFDGDTAVKARTNALIVASLAAFLGAYVFLNFYVYRFMIYTVPLIATLIFPVALIALVRKNPAIKYDHVLISIILIFALTMQFDNKNPSKMGYAVHINDDYKKVFDFVSSQPKDTMFAGWPGHSEVIDWVPYISKRKVLLTRKLHYIPYYDYAMEMRKRMYATIEAYFAVDIEPIRYLRDTFGVDFLIVDTNYFTEKPEYFVPFNKKIDYLWDKNKDKTFELQKHLDKAVFHLDNIYIFDLRTIAR